MTAEIINLRQARKQRARDEKETTAAENRIKFGRTKAEREHETVEKGRVIRAFEAHKRDDSDPK